MDKNPAMKLIDAFSARTRFGDLMERAEKQNLRFLVSRRGTPRVVILSVEDYLRDIIKQPTILTKIQLGAQGAGLDKMTNEEIEAEIEAYRKSKR